MSFRKSLRTLALSTPLVVAALLAVPATAVAPAGPAPQFKLASLGGKEINLAQYKGQVVMINFWASWCGPCRDEMPILEKLHAKDWLKSTPVSFPILLDTKSEVSKLYSVASMPSTVIVDRKGNVRWSHKGYKAGDENEYLNQIRALVRE
jgi:peroxiredoxin